MEKRRIRTIIGCVLMSAVDVSGYATLSNYIEPIKAAFNVNQNDTAIIFTLHSLACMVVSLFFKKMLEKMKVRPLVILGGVLFSTFFLSLAFCRSFITVLVGAALMGVSFVFSGLVMSHTVATWWADKNAGRTISYISIGFGVMSFIISPVIAKSIAAIGLRSTALIHGVAGGAAIILIGLFLISEHPSAYGAESGDTEEAAPAVKNSFAPMKTVYFWLIMVAALFFNTALNGFNNNAATFYQTIGATPVEASYGISVYGIMAVAWSYLHGYVADKKGPGAATALCAAAGGAILLAAPLFRGFAGVLSIGFVIGSMSIGGNITAIAVPHVFGKERGAKLMGFANLAASVSGMLGTLIASAIYEASGSYDLYLLLAGSATLLSIILILAGCGKRAKECAAKLDAE